MTSLFASLIGWTNYAAATANQAAFAFLPLLAQSEEEEARPYTIEVALILLCLVLGIFVSLKPSKRETEVKKVHEEPE
ncbi:MAG: hypothetical protein AAGF31_01850 [Planctomycetota bacterium]